MKRTTIWWLGSLVSLLAVSIHTFVTFVILSRRGVTREVSWQFLFIAAGAVILAAWIFVAFVSRQQRTLNKNRQLQVLNDAAANIAGEVALTEVLQKVVDWARELVGAHYGVVHTPPFGEAGGHLITSGPHIEGSLGPAQGSSLYSDMVQSARTIRVADVAKLPAAAGFPPGHPPIRSFLGVPIRSHGRVTGLLYLAEKVGAPEFTREDEDVAVLLANQAAVAIEKARLYEETRRVSEHLHQVIETSKDAIVTVGPGGEVRLWNAGATALYGYTRREAEGGMLPVIPHEDLDVFLSLVRAACTGQAVPDREQYHLRKDGTRVSVLMSLSPLSRGSQGAREVLLVARDMTVIRRLEAERRRLALLEERDRIGMDLHDGAIQALYGVGLNLEALKRIVGHEHHVVRRRLAGTIEQLNRVIQDLRAYALENRSHGVGGAGLERRLVELVRWLEEAGVRVSLAIEPGADQMLPPDVAEQLSHIAGKAISNVRRHSRAQECRVELIAGGDRISLIVADDGQGFQPGADTLRGRLGLRNIKARGHLLGGECTILSAPGKGTVVRVDLPAQGG